MTREEKKKIFSHSAEEASSCLARLSCDDTRTMDSWGFENVSTERWSLSIGQFSNLLSFFC